MPDKGTYPTALAAQLGTNLHRELRDALDDRDFLEDGGLVGIPCMHLYEQVGERLRCDGVASVAVADVQREVG